MAQLDNLLIYIIIVVVAGFILTISYYNDPYNQYSKVDKVVNYDFVNGFNFQNSKEFKELNENSFKTYHKSIFELDFQKEFIPFISVNYKYSKLTDCKFWSWIYYNYVIRNPQNFTGARYVLTNNHIFVIGYSDDYYYLFDQLNIMRFNLK